MISFKERSFILFAACIRLRLGYDYLNNINTTAGLPYYLKPSARWFCGSIGG
jgi:hypothetical protein